MEAQCYITEPHTGHVWMLGRRAQMCPGAVPPGARSTDPDTSHEAAGPTIGRASQQRMLLKAYNDAEDGLTNEEAGIATGLIDDRTNCYWKRCSELSAMGLIEPNGDKRRSRANRSQRVHTITDAGRKAAASP